VWMRDVGKMSNKPNRKQKSDRKQGEDEREGWAYYSLDALGRGAQAKGTTHSGSGGSTYHKS